MTLGLPQRSLEDKKAFAKWLSEEPAVSLCELDVQSVGNNYKSKHERRTEINTLFIRGNRCSKYIY